MTDARSDTSHFSICFILSLLFYWSTDTGSGEADVTAGDAGSAGGDFFLKLMQWEWSELKPHAGRSYWTRTWRNEGAETRTPRFYMLRIIIIIVTLLKEEGLKALRIKDCFAKISQKPPEPSELSSNYVKLKISKKTLMDANSKRAAAS